MATLGERLWEPDDDYLRRARVTGYMRWLKDTRGMELNSYHDLWRWSVSDLDGFWRTIWQYCGPGDGLPEGPLLVNAKMPGAVWCPGMRVNFASYLLQQGQDDKVAIHFFSETRAPGQMTWGELRRQVVSVARGLRDMGVEPGDRVAAFVPNTPEAVVALLATTLIGGVWSSCSPDFGVNSALDRFRQIEPKVLIAVDGYSYGGKVFDRRGALNGLLNDLPSVQRIIYLSHMFAPDEGRPDGARSWSELTESSALAADDPTADQLLFDHPLWIVYSSGTTGLPKGMVHGHGGILFEMLKGQNLQLDLSPESTMFFYTTTGWIMFNMLVGALVAGASIVLYDGNPAYPDLSTLWRLVERTGATSFGTSPTFVHTMAQNRLCPREQFDLSSLRNVLCTGSPLTPESFSWIYENVKENLWVSSISGGTDVSGGFVAGSPILPVHSGEIQAPCLGVDVCAFDRSGTPIVGEEGELVITQPMPSMPLYFWGDPGGKRYHESYFDTYPGVWRHGDLLKETERGSYIIAGRSDSTLNRHGIRIGTSEVYRTVVELAEVVDSLVVHLAPAGRPDQLILFVVLAQSVVLDDGLKLKLARALREQRSPRHVPEQVLAVSAIPYTLTGKKMEVPVKRILLGADPDEVANRDAMGNPSSIEEYTKFAKQMSF